MKWILCVVVCICVFSKIVDGARASKPIKSLQVDPYKVIYGADNTYLEEGVRNKKITCKGYVKNQKIEWYDPEGNLVKRDPTNRVYVLESLLSPVPSKTLIFTTTDTSDSGVWECRSDDLVQEVALCVMDTANFISTSDEMTVDAGRSITLTCQSNGNPEPKVQWYRDGELLVEDDEKYFTSTKYNQHGFEALLTIKSLLPEDMGEYVCEAVQANPLFEDCNHTISANVTLNVNHAPVFLSSESVIFAEDGENITLTCEPSAYPVPEFRWFSGNMNKEFSNKQFKVSENGSQSTLPLVANSTTFDKEFKCKAKNDFGHSVNTYHIFRMQEPEQLKATTEFVAQERRLYFNFTWDDEAVFPIDSYDIQYFEKTAIGEPKDRQWNEAKIVHYDDVWGSRVHLKNLKINTEYWVRIRACNQLGAGPWSANILASTAYDYDNEPMDLGIFLGVVVTAVIVVFGAACIHLVKKL